VEFAFVLPLLLVLTMSAVDFGRAFFVRNIMEQGAREGCRLAVVTDPDTAQVRNRVQQVCGAAGVAPRSVTVEGPDGGRLITVRVEADFAWIAPGILRFVGVAIENPITLRAQATMRHER
jgi:Flp pilus assembly protein TadG